MVLCSGTPTQHTVRSVRALGQVIFVNTNNFFFIIVIVFIANNKYHVTVKNAIRNRGSGVPPPPPSTIETSFPNPIGSTTTIGFPAPTRFTTHAPGSSSDASAPTQSPLPDPRWTARVRRPKFTLDLRDIERASSTPTPVIGQPTPRRNRNSHLF